MTSLRRRMSEERVRTAARGGEPAVPLTQREEERAKALSRKRTRRGKRNRGDRNNNEMADMRVSPPSTNEEHAQVQTSIPSETSTVGMLSEAALHAADREEIRTIRRAHRIAEKTGPSDVHPDSALGRMTSGGGTYYEEATRVVEGTIPIEDWPTRDEDDVAGGMERSTPVSKRAEPRMGKYGDFLANPLQPGSRVAIEDVPSDEPDALEQLIAEEGRDEDDDTVEEGREDDDTVGILDRYEKLARAAGVPDTDDADDDAVFANTVDTDEDQRVYHEPFQTNDIDIDGQPPFVDTNDHHWVTPEYPDGWKQTGMRKQLEATGPRDDTNRRRARMLNRPDRRRQFRDEHRAEVLKKGGPVKWMKSKLRRKNVQSASQELAATLRRSALAEREILEENRANVRDVLRAPEQERQELVHALRANNEQKRTEVKLGEIGKDENK